MNHHSLNKKLERHLALLSQDKNNVPLLITISDLYCELNDLESAQKHLDTANSIEPTACLASQGLLYLNQGELTKAQENFQEALNYTSTPALRYNLAFTYFLTSDLEKASELLLPLIKEEHLPTAELLMARIAHRQQELEKAIHLVENILEYNANDAEALGFLALLYFDMNEELLAKELSQRALALDPGIYDARVINILLRLMTQETSVEEIEELVHINPEDPRLWFALGNTYMTQGDIDSAESTLNKAIDLYPEFYDCYIALAWCQLLNNQIQVAHETYQNAIELSDEMADAWGGLALVYALSSDFSKAEELIKKANSLNPECFLTEIAQLIYFNHKNPEQAKEHLITILKNTELPISIKLAEIIKEIQ